MYRNYRIWLQRLILAFVTVILLIVCSYQAEYNPFSSNKQMQHTVSGKAPSAEDLALYDQVLLFLQEGMREHQITGFYIVYFPEISAQSDSINLILQDNNGYFFENLTYCYNVSEDWYIFSGSYEPVLAGISSSKPNKQIQHLVNKAVYHAPLSVGLDLNAGIRYTAPQGPVVYDDVISSFPDDSDIYKNIYLYQDDRLDFTARIQYPQFFIAVNDMESSCKNKANQIIRNSFFMGDGADNQNSLHPEQQMNGIIERDYQITRADKSYLSMRIYEFNIMLVTQMNRRLA